jgi:tetratricopeptide (TPR) repeat protein
MILLLGILVISGSLEPAKEFIAVRDYERAIAEYEAILNENPQSIEALKGLARVYQTQRTYGPAKIYWEKVLKLNPQDDEAALNHWTTSIRETPEDEGVRISIEMAMVEYLKALPERQRALSLGYDTYRLLEDSTPQISYRDSILSEFPDSPKGYELIGDEFYDGLYPIWEDDSAKVEYLKEFLMSHPVSEWRFTAYQWLLSSLYRLKQFDELVLVGERMLDEDALNPFAYNDLVGLYLEAELDTDRAREYARRAIELEPGYKRPSNLPHEQWALRKPALYGDARFNYARALTNLGQFDSAQVWLEDAITNTKFDFDDYHTPCPYYYLLGQVKEAKGLIPEALDAYIHALCEGDMVNRWTARADSAFLTLYEKEFGTKEGLMDYARIRMGYKGIIFDDVTKEVGLAGVRAARVAWGDYDSDGYDDLLLGNHLFHNLSGERFVEVTDMAGLGGNTSGGVWADYDNDGDLDLYAISSKADILYENQGDLRFRDVTQSAGLTDTLPTEGAGWADYDLDGFVDLYIARYEDWATQDYFSDILYHNLGDGRFEDVTEEAGIIPWLGADRAGRGVNWGDYDGDGDPDCYVSNYRLHENFLWENQGDGRFINQALKRGVAGVEKDGWWGHTIGSEWGDYDGDGDLDLICCNLAHPRYIEFSNRTQLLENSGPPDFRFYDRRAASGIRYDETHSDPGWGDLDKDGDLDLYITSVYENRRSFLYENLGSGKFRDITWLSGVRRFNGWGCAFSDYDQDGDLDLLVGSGSGVKLFRNRGNSNHWLSVKVLGQRSNRAGIGTRIWALQEDKLQLREVQGGKGTTSQHSLLQFFGFGEIGTPIRLEVCFPSGITKTLKVRPGQPVTVRE